jgi:hypothetical protein
MREDSGVDFQLSQLFKEEKKVKLDVDTWDEMKIIMRKKKLFLVIIMGNCIRNFKA